MLGDGGDELGGSEDLEISAATLTARRGRLGFVDNHAAGRVSTTTRRMRLIRRLLKLFVIQPLGMRRKVGVYVHKFDCMNQLFLLAYES